MGSCSIQKNVKKQEQMVVTNQAQDDKPRIEKKQQKNQSMTPVLAKTNQSDIVNESSISNRSPQKVHDAQTQQIQIKSGLFRIYTLLTSKSDFDLEKSEDKQIKLVQHNVNGIKKRVQTIDKYDTSTENFIQKIQRNKLQNDYICPITNIYEDRENYYLLSDYCSGGSLSTQKGKLNDSQVMILLNQMINAISYLHSKKIVHGTLSLDSFHLLSDLNSLFCKLVDVSCIFQGNEQVQIEASLENYAEDVYALGMIGYQLLTGEMPYKQNKNKQEEQNESEPQLEFKDGISPILKRILKKMLEKNIYERITLEQAKKQLSKNDQRNKQSDVLIKPLYFLSICKPRNYFHVVILAFMLKKFNKEEECNLEKIFKDADFDQDGLLKKEDILLLYKSIIEYENINVDTQQLLKKLDVKNKDSIELKEFISGALNIEELLQQSYLETCFKYLQNQKGQITSRSVKKHIEINQKLFVQTLEEIKGQHKLNYNEFTEIMRQLF